MLIGNKKDLEEQRDVSYQEAQQFAEENGIFFLAKSIINYSLRIIISWNKCQNVTLIFF